MTTTNYFTTKTRTDGTAYTATTDDAPQWVTDTVYNCHDITGDSPDDWTYRTIAYIFDLMHSEPRLDAFEVGEILTDFYSVRLHEWATPNRWALIDEACQELAEPGATTERRIEIGQWSHIAQIAEIIIQAIEDNTDQEG